MEQPTEVIEKIIDAATADDVAPASAPCKDQCSQHQSLATTINKIDKRTKLTLWIALALLAQALGWQVIPRIVPAAEAAIRAVWP